MRLTYNILFCFVALFALCEQITAQIDCESYRSYKSDLYKNYTGECTCTSNGKLIEKGSIVNGVEHGKFIKYYLNGKQKHECYYSFGLISGASIFYDTCGYKTWCNIRGNDIDTLIYYFFHSDKIRSIQLLSNHNIRILNTEYNFDGQMNYRHVHNLDTKNDTISEWYNNGKLKKLSIYKLPCGKTNGDKVLYTITFYYENGIVKLTKKPIEECKTIYLNCLYNITGQLIEIYSENSDGIKQDSHWWFNLNGKPKKLVNHYDDNTNKGEGYNGEYKEWFADGNIKIEGMYKYNTKDGIWKSWDSISHLLIDSVFFVNGIASQTRKKVVEMSMDTSEYKYNKFGIRLTYDLQKKLYGLIDKKGEIILPIEYSMIYFYIDSFVKIYITEQIVNGNKYYGLTNDKGYILLPCEWINILYFPRFGPFVLVDKGFSNPDMSNYNLHWGTYIYYYKTNTLSKKYYDHIIEKLLPEKEYLKTQFVFRQNCQTYYFQKTRTHVYYPAWVYFLKPVNSVCKIILFPIVYPLEASISGMGGGDWTTEDYWDQEGLNFYDYSYFSKCIRRGKWYWMDYTGEIHTHKQRKENCN